MENSQNKFKKGCVILTQPFLYPFTISQQAPQNHPISHICPISLISLISLIASHLAGDFAGFAGFCVGVGRLAWGAAI